MGLIIKNPNDLIPGAAVTPFSTPDVPALGGQQATGQAVRNLGQGVTNLGLGMYKRAVDMSRRKAELDADNEFAKYEESVINSKEQRRLDKAKGFAAETSVGYTKFRDDIIKQYDEPVIQQTIKERAQPRMAALGKETLSWEIEQSKAALKNTYDANAESAANRGMRTSQLSGPTADTDSVARFKEVQSTVREREMVVTGDTDATSLNSKALNASTVAIYNGYMAIVADPTVNHGNMLKQLDDYATQGLVDNGDDRILKLRAHLKDGASTGNATAWTMARGAQARKDLKGAEAHLIRERVLGDIQREAERRQGANVQLSDEDATWILKAQAALELLVKPLTTLEDEKDKYALGSVATTLHTRRSTATMFATREEFRRGVPYQGLTTWGKKQADDLFDESNKGKGPGGLTPEQLADEVRNAYANAIHTGVVQYSPKSTPDEDMEVIARGLERKTPGAGIEFMRAVTFLKNVAPGNLMFSRVEKVHSRDYPEYLAAKGSMNFGEIATVVNGLADAVTVRNEQDRVELKGSVLWAAFEAGLHTKQGQVRNQQLASIIRQKADKLRIKLEDRLMSWASSRDEAVDRAATAGAAATPEPTEIEAGKVLLRYEDGTTVEVPFSNKQVDQIRGLEKTGNFELLHDGRKAIITGVRWNNLQGSGR